MFADKMTFNLFANEHKGVMDIVTQSLVRLHEQENRPDDPLHFIVDYMEASLSNQGVDVMNLCAEKDKYIQELTHVIEETKAKLIPSVVKLNELVIEKSDGPESETKIESEQQKVKPELNSEQPETKIEKPDLKTLRNETEPEELDVSEIVTNQREQLELDFKNKTEVTEIRFETETELLELLESETKSEPTELESAESETKPRQPDESETKTEEAKTKTKKPQLEYETSSEPFALASHSSTEPVLGVLRSETRNKQSEIEPEKLKLNGL
ncbi:hypothetical protein WDU94_007665 [Cyamophila willieti]